MQPTTEPHNATLVEKTPLETYVPPARPSLIGLSRTELADRLGEIGVAPAQRKMRVQQLWHWMYFRGAQNFEEMTSVSKGIRAELAQHFTVDRPEVVAEQISTTAPANGCCGCRAATMSSGRMKSSASTSPKPIAARCVCPPRSAAR